MSATKPLGLRIKRKWLQEIVSGKKKIEYRDFSEHYASRLGIWKGDECWARKDIPATRLYVSSKEYAIVEIKDIDFNDEGTVFQIHLGRVLEDKSGNRLKPTTGR